MNEKKFAFNSNIKELEVDPRFVEEGVAFAVREKHAAIRVIDLSGNPGQACDLDLSPLSNNNSILSLSIADNFKISKINIDSIYSMGVLEKLSFQDKKIKPNFSRLQNLKILYMKYGGVPSGFSSLKNLKSLLVTSISDRDCDFLSGLAALKDLRLSGGAVQSLSGVEDLSNLCDVKIDHCPKLEDASALGELRGLMTLHIEKCKNLVDFSFLEKNDSIENLFVSDLNSISFISSMKKVRTLRFWNLVDGDLSPALAAKSLQAVDFYPNKKHYSQSKEEINILLSQRKI